jgi:hypothetical protein
MGYELFGLKLLTTEEAGEALGLSSVQVKRLLNAGHLYGEKFNNQWLIPEMSIRSFRYIQSEREKLLREAQKLENILGEFLSRGDITKTYYDKAIERVREFTGKGEG